MVEGPAPMPRGRALAQARELPAHNGGWLAAVLPGSLPEESVATCDRCAMCDPSPPSLEGVGGASGDFYFDPRTKCCTYHPDLPNFLVGRILSDPDPGLDRARAILEARISSGIAVNRLGLHPPEEYLSLFRENVAAFGQRVELRCPFYETESGRCGIWAHRSGVCSTWFCKHDRGATGASFWKALGALLMAVEESLAEWAATQAERSVGGRSAPFFRECARLVEPLDGEQAMRIGGEAVARRALAAREAYERLAIRALPDTVRRGGCEAAMTGPGRVRVTTYTPFDPLEIPLQLFQAIEAFDEGSPAELLDRMARQTGAWTPSSLIGRLLDFEILVPGGQPAR